ncbi:hypothetical protein N0V93_006981 [Gnomoniopsis smithogilvyi]|uniref:SnoaL-like domain-containing protein n=1 Tax=Gnomoniopsis smithogilvyi TaxID=1191159 RepID=A0A9W9CW46_9PEZI|nr:hypothetical protein N0V93_006981 [Gnomoniopsis smithogilvyi]
MRAAAEAQAATLQLFIDAWRRWNAEETISLFATSENFRQVTMPFQMNMPERTRSEVEQTLPFLVRAVSNYELQIHRVIHDQQKGEAAIYALSKGNTPFGPWHMEYAVFLTFTGSGDKIARIEEMLDSNHAQWFGPHLRKWIQSQTGTGAPGQNTGVDL